MQNISSVLWCWLKSRGTKKIWLSIRGGRGDGCHFKRGVLVKCASNGVVDVDKMNAVGPINDLHGRLKTVMKRLLQL